MPGVKAGYSLRTGGGSQGPYASFNLGDHVGDDAHDVQTNRAQLARTLGVSPLYLNQVHGTRVQALPAAQGSQADAAYATQAQTACCILVADCLPILISDNQGSVVAAAHAGWRGLCGEHGVGVIESLLQALRASHPSASWLAWLGPCIGPQAFEVGPEVRQAFVQAHAHSARHFKAIAERSGKWWCDLPGLARERLTACGVGQVWGNDGSSAWCTHSRPEVFFSHRRDKVSGRQAAVIFLE